MFNILKRDFISKKGYYQDFLILQNSMDRKRKAVVHVRRVNADCAIYSDKIVHAKFVVVVVVVVVVWICFYYVFNNLDKFNLKKNIKRK